MCLSWMGLITEPPAPLPPPPTHPPAYPLHQPRLGFHLPHVSVTTASHVRSSGDIHKGPIEELGCHPIRAHCPAPQVWGRMGTPDLRHLSCPLRLWRGQPSQGQGKETPGLAVPSPQQTPPFFPSSLPAPWIQRTSCTQPLSPLTHTSPILPAAMSPHHPSWAWGWEWQGQDPTSVLSPSLGALAPRKRLRRSSFLSHHHTVEGLNLQRSKTNQTRGNRRKPK